MKPILTATIFLLAYNIVNANKVIHEEREGSWVGYKIKCSSGKREYVTKTKEGYWANGKAYNRKRMAINKACSGK